MPVVPEFIKRPLRHRNLLLRPAVIRELTKIAEDEPTFGNQLVVYHSGDALYEKMLADIESAQSRVLCEFYMFGSDAVAWEFARQLGRKAKVGVEVRVIYDSLGSIDATWDIFEYMHARGVLVLEYRPINPCKRRFGVFGRDHRKVLVVDEQLGYIGGFNLGRYWSEKCEGDRAWRDSHLRVAGPAALDLAVLFAETWHRETGVLLSIDQFAVEREHENQSNPSDGAHAQEVGTENDPPGGTLIIGGRGHYRRRIRRLYQLEIDRASERLFLINPYVIPDRAIREALCRAADRGVDVRFLLPDVSDVRLADLAGRRYFQKYLERGIRIYLY